MFWLLQNSLDEKSEHWEDIGRERTKCWVSKGSRHVAIVQAARPYWVFEKILTRTDVWVWNSSDSSLERERGTCTSPKWRCLEGGRFGKSSDASVSHLMIIDCVIEVVRMDYSNYEIEYITPLASLMIPREVLRLFEYGDVPFWFTNTPCKGAVNQKSFLNLCRDSK